MILLLKFKQSSMPLGFWIVHKNRPPSKSGRAVYGLAVLTKTRVVTGAPPDELKVLCSAKPSW